MLDKAHEVVYNDSIFYERTVNTMKNNFKSQMPKLNIIIKHGVCPKCTAMC